MATKALSDEDDETLALKVAADKDREAASMLVARYAPKLKGYLTAHFDPTLKSHGVKDAVQETFLRMIKYIASYKRKVAPFEAWMIRIAHNVALDMLADKEKHTYEAFADEPVFYAAAESEDCEDDGKKDWRTKILDDLIENKLKGFEQAVARDYVGTGGDIDPAKLMREWGKTRNHVDVAKSVVKKKFQQALIAAEKQRERERGKT
jgi:RNA polymerase sigma-70 factor (ECF subfamily)